jgi:hypothetical protein
MLRRLVTRARLALEAANENVPARRPEGTVAVSDVRAVATGAALAAAVDVSPAVLVTLWPYAQRLYASPRSRRRP